MGYQHNGMLTPINSVHQKQVATSTNNSIPIPIPIPISYQQPTLPLYESSNQDMTVRSFDLSFPPSSFN